MKTSHEQTNSSNASNDIMQYGCSQTYSLPIGKMNVSPQTNFSIVLVNVLNNAQRKTMI